MENILKTPPTYGMVVAAGILGGTMGYYLGMGKSLFGAEAVRERQRKAAADSEDEDEEEELATEDGDPDFKSAAAGLEECREECKMVFVVRTDLGMTKGKIAAQCGHATLACYKKAMKHAPAYVRAWERYGQAKIATKGESEDELLILQATALSLGLPAAVIHDAGRTQIAAGSATVLGVGPGPKSLVDQVTGGQKLL